MIKFLKVFVLMLALTATLALAACGGSDSSDDSSDDSSSGGTSTKADFIAQADEICAKGDQEIEAVAKQEFGDKVPSTADAIAFTSKTVIPNIEGQIADLRDLTPPEGDEDAITSLLDSLEKGTATIKEDPASSLSGASPLADANKQADAYGFDSCGI